MSDIKHKKKVAIIAPSSSVENAKAKLISACHLLESKGLIPSHHPDIISKTEPDFFAANYDVRFAGLKAAIEDPGIDIIWAFRGGYGATELIHDCLDLTPANNKILIGFSDITALHFLFNQHYRMPSIHGSVLTSAIGFQSAMVDEIFSLLDGGRHEISLAPLTKKAKKGDRIKGALVGGNLAVLCNLIGTKLHPKTEGKILILEDVDERGYEVHRYLMHLKNAGLFDGVQAVIFGDFIKGDKLVGAAINDFCSRHLQSMVVYNCQGFGHDAVNRPVWLGKVAVIENDKLTG